MKTALFVPLNAHGHINPTFLLAKKMQEMGIRVVYACTFDYQQKIVNEGFEFSLINSQPFGIGIEDRIDWKKKTNYLENLLDRMKDISYNGRKANYIALFEKYKPDYLLVDMFLSTDFIVTYPLLQKYATKYFYLQAQLPSINDGATPPLNTKLLPDDTIQIKWAWKKVGLKRNYYQFIDKIKYFGFDNETLIKRKFHINGVPDIFRKNNNKVFFYSYFQNITEIVMAPIEFEFNKKRLLPNQFYIGCTIKMEEQKMDIKYDKLFTKIKEAKHKSRKIIYCSLGSLSTLHTKGKSELFFKKIIEIFKDKNDFELVLSVGEDIKDKINTDAKNIHVFGTVPQKTLLPYCNLFLNHGGLNSVLESVLAKVPMICYPLNNKWDQNSTTARSVYQGIGQYGNLKDAPSQIFLTIENALKTKDLKLNCTILKLKLEKNKLNTELIQNILNTELLIQ